MIKAIVLDLDGSLLNSRKEITPDTKQALLRAQKAGIRLALASARSLNGLARFARQLELERNHGMLICYNGGLITDAQSGDTLYSRAMPKELAAEICRFLKQYDVIPMIDRGSICISMMLSPERYTITAASWTSSATNPEATSS